MKINAFIKMLGSRVVCFLGSVIIDKYEMCPYSFSFAAPTCAMKLSTLFLQHPITTHTGGRWKTFQGLETVYTVYTFSYRKKQILFRNNICSPMASSFGLLVDIPSSPAFSMFPMSSIERQQSNMDISVGT